MKQIPILRARGRKKKKTEGGREKSKQNNRRSTKLTLNSLRRETMSEHAFLSFRLLMFFFSGRYEKGADSPSEVELFFQSCSFLFSFCFAFSFIFTVVGMTLLFFLYCLGFLSSPLFSVLLALFLFARSHWHCFA